MCLDSWVGEPRGYSPPPQNHWSTSRRVRILSEVREISREIFESLRNRTIPEKIMKEKEKKAITGMGEGDLTRVTRQSEGICFGRREGGGIGERRDWRIVRSKNRRKR